MFQQSDSQNWHYAPLEPSPLGLIGQGLTNGQNTRTKSEEHWSEEFVQAPATINNAEWCSKRTYTQNKKRNWEFEGIYGETQQLFVCFKGIFYNYKGKCAFGKEMLSYFSQEGLINFSFFFTRLLHFSRCLGRHHIGNFQSNIAKCLSGHISKILLCTE